MPRVPLVPLILIALGALFLFLALFDARKNGTKSTPARKAWLRVAAIFIAVSVYLLIFQLRVP